MTSLECKVSKFFKKVKEYLVIKRNASFFDEIMSFDEWNLSIYSFREKLQEKVAHA